MSGISIGAVGAAIIAGLISIFGLILGKEQKVSEFRQAWIDELRKAFIDYLVQLNQVVDAKRLEGAGKGIEDVLLLKKYEDLNRAQHSIIFRINKKEKNAEKLIEVLDKFEDRVGAKDPINLVEIKEVEFEFVELSQKILKEEWNRVKRGERSFVWAKRAVYGALVVLFSVLIFLMLYNLPINLFQQDDPEPPLLHFLGATPILTSYCYCFSGTACAHPEARSSARPPCVQLRDSRRWRP